MITNKAITRNETTKKKFGYHDVDKVKRSKANKTQRGKAWHWEGLGE